MAAGDNLFEAVTADTIAHETARASKHSLPIGTPCPNCHTALAGPWCYACGQRGEKYNRSIWRLMGEALEALVELDGRVWQTFPRLIVRLLVFFAGGLSVTEHRQNLKLVTLGSPELQKELSTKDRADLQQAMQSIRTELDKPKPSAKPSEKWLRAQLVKALGNPDAFKASMAEWAQRFAVLMLPIAALLLTVLFVFKKGVYIFDHLIFSMHSLSFQGLLLTAVFLLGLAVDGASWLLLLSPVHLFMHMRGTYRTSVIGTLIRMFLLFIGSTWAFGFLIVGLLFVGLATLR